MKSSKFTTVPLITTFFYAILPLSEVILKSSLASREADALKGRDHMAEQNTGNIITLSMTTFLAL